MSRNIIDKDIILYYIAIMSNVTHTNVMNIFVRNIPDEIGNQFNAAVALDGQTLSEVMSNLMEEYADRRFTKLQKESEK